MALINVSSSLAFPNDRQGTLKEIDALPVSASVDNIIYFNSPNPGKYLKRVIDGSIRAMYCGIYSGSADMTARFNAAVSHSSISTLVLDNNVSGSIPVSGTITIPLGKILKFERGNIISGSGTLNGGIIDASHNIQIFSPNFTINPDAVTNQTVSSVWFGDTGNNTANDQIAIQKAISTIIANQTKFRALYTPSTSSFGINIITGSLVFSTSGSERLLINHTGSIRLAAYTGSGTRVLGVLNNGYLVPLDQVSSSLSSVSSSYSLSSSYAVSASNVLSASYSVSSSYALSSSYAVSSSFTVTASYAVTASYIATASYAFNSFAADYATEASASLIAVSASYVESASYALSASYAANVPGAMKGLSIYDDGFGGKFVVLGQELNDPLFPAVLNGDREIPMYGSSIYFTGGGNIIIGKDTNDYLGATMQVVGSLSMARFGGTDPATLAEFNNYYDYAAPFTTTPTNIRSIYGNNKLTFLDTTVLSGDNFIAGISSNFSLYSAAADAIHYSGSENPEHAVSSLVGRFEIIGYNNQKITASGWWAGVKAELNLLGSSSIANFSYFQAGGDTYDYDMNGIITNGYGLFISPLPPIVTNRWGIYQSGSNDKNYFGGAARFNNSIIDKNNSSGSLGQFLMSTVTGSVWTTINTGSSSTGSSVNILGPDYYLTLISGSDTLSSSIAYQSGNKIIMPGAITDSTLKIAGMEFQSVDYYGSWITDNAYVDGINWRYRTDSSATILYLDKTNFFIRMFTYASAGTVIPNATGSNLKLDLSGSFAIGMGMDPYPNSLSGSLFSVNGGTGTVNVTNLSGSGTRIVGVTSTGNLIPVSTVSSSISASYAANVLPPGNGLSVSSSVIALGQNIGQSGDPAILASNREIPMGGYNLSLLNGNLGVNGAASTAKLTVTQDDAITSFPRTKAISSDRWAAISAGLSGSQLDPYIQLGENNMLDGTVILTGNGGDNSSLYLYKLWSKGTGTAVLTGSTTPDNAIETLYIKSGITDNGNVALTGWYASLKTQLQINGGDIKTIENYADIILGSSIIGGGGTQAIANRYGLYISSVNTNVTTKAYAIFQSGSSDLNLFRGPVIFSNSIVDKNNSSGSAGQVLTYTTGGAVWAAPNTGSDTLPGGSNTHVQYNLSGSFAGTGSFTFDKSNTRLTIGTVPTSSARLNIEPTINIPSVQVGGLTLQSLGATSALLSANNYYNGGYLQYRSAGAATALHMFDNRFLFFVAEAGGAGDFMVPLAKMTIGYEGIFMVALPHFTASNDNMLVLDSSGEVGFRAIPTGSATSSAVVPGGLHSYIQYNSASTFAGDIDFRFDGTVVRVGSGSIEDNYTPQRLSVAADVSSSTDQTLLSLSKINQMTASIGSAQAFQGHSRLLHTDGDVFMAVGVVGTGELSGSSDTSRARLLKGVEGGTFINGNGHVVSASSLYSAGITITGNGVVTNSYGIYLKKPVVIGSGTIVNNYAIYSEAGQVVLGDLSGSGTRMVVADDNGLLSTQTVPSGGGGGTTNNYYSQWTSSGANIYYNLGNVSVGSTNGDSASLYVYRDTNVVNKLLVQSNHGGAFASSLLELKSNGGSGYIYKVGTGNVGGTANDFIIQNEGGGLIKFYTDQLERVSIGESVVMSSLTGSGTRMVVASAGGTLSTQTIPSGGSGSTSPGGSDTHIQFNDSNTFGGSSDFTWDRTKVHIGNGDLTNAPTASRFTAVANISSSNGSVLLGMFRSNQTVATAGSIQGVEGYTRTTHPSGTVTLAIGTIGNTEHSGSGTVTSFRSLQGGGILSGNGTVTNFMSIYAASPTVTGTGTITNAYGMYVTTPTSGSGAITNRYGIYLEDIGNNHYAISSQGGRAWFNKTTNTVSDAVTNNLRLLVDQGINFTASAYTLTSGRETPLFSRVSIDNVTVATSSFTRGRFISGIQGSLYIDSTTSDSLITGSGILAAIIADVNLGNSTMQYSKVAALRTQYPATSGVNGRIHNFYSLFLAGPNDDEGSGTSAARITTSYGIYQEHSASLNVLNGSLRVGSLTGVGNRVVTADFFGNLSASAVIDSGTYTPSFSNYVNGSDAAVLGTTWIYMRVGNMVTVQGNITSWDATGAGAMSLNVSLPISTTFTSIGQAGGGGYNAEIKAVTAGGANLVDIAYTPGAVGAGPVNTIYFTFSYRVQ